MQYRTVREVFDCRTNAHQFLATSGHLRLVLLLHEIILEFPQLGELYNRRVGIYVILYCLALRHRVSKSQLHLERKYTR